MKKPRDFRLPGAATLAGTSLSVDLQSELFGQLVVALNYLVPSFRDPHHRRVPQEPGSEHLDSVSVGEQPVEICVAIDVALEKRPAIGSRRGAHG